VQGRRFMMSDVRIDIIAIGSLAKNKYWGEKAAVRNEYATTTLVRAGKVVLIVDPGWPAEVLRSALYYRAGLEPQAVTHVFLTHLDAAHSAGSGLFEKAVWWAYEEEISYAEAEWPAEAPGRRVLAHMAAAPEKLAPGVDLYPTFGHTPGHSSLLIYTPMHSTVIAGDAVLTQDHLEHGDLGESPWDLAKAKASFQDIVEIADMVVPGHDNVVLCRSTGSL
jgi:glyoxylase-like metal-dependent hydrolase (beta-lactamase superfamily II)